ncbi:F-box protein CPR1-like [Silene latifolia]|uniref:F-box protein CPR1-like n=1 Tax=Silene latifolia TaxID=37657 RepID=UPI003D7755F0
MASQTLPSDIIIDILKRLPSKTLIRFKSISKQWYSLINSPNFINLHLTQTLISQNSTNLIISQYSLSSVTISDENNPNFHLIELDHPLKHFCKADNLSSYARGHMPQILGSINGVVCISMNDNSSVVLYNPSTKTHRFIPPFPPSPNPIPIIDIMLAGSGNVNHAVLGFGFDSVRKDYNVLRIIEKGNLSGSVHRETSVYSLKNDSWKCVDNLTMMGKFIFQNGMGVVVNELLHFIVRAANFITKIVCFDLRTETFSTFDLPIRHGTHHDDELVCRKQLFMKELGGCFGVLVNYQFGMSGLYSMVFADLWVMKEYGNKESWFRLFSIHDLSTLNVYTYVRPVLYSRDKERVLLELDGLSFGWYSLDSKKLDRITVHGWLSANSCFETWTFVDSLVSIGKDKDKAKPKVVPKKNKNKDDFLSSGFKLRL